MERAPTIEDFLDMQPIPEMEGRLAKVDTFVQLRPSDGQPGSQRTEAYLGYDHHNLYIIFVAFDDEPEKIRARMVSRERFVDERATGIDDLVSVSLDTFADQRRGYVFQVNPFGIQWDGLFSDGGGFDASFDALWYSHGKLTARGYVVWIAIPFKSLRFPPTSEQTWGLLLNRDIPRTNEAVFWPHFSSRIQGYFNQATRITGMREISPGRNLQFIPYAGMRSFRALDTRDPLQPLASSRRAEVSGGLDSKIVFKDSLVLDFTANPDFSQVESDEPQVTVNERFEVFFPEKRPFFLENTSFFRTPNNLLFTRRIADPRLGARLTGKVGRTAIGALIADDESPGRRVPRGHPLAGSRALFGVLRVSQDIFSQSSVGAIFTDRDFREGFNRVGGIDGRFKLGQNWTSLFQAVTSTTRFLDGRRLAGPAYDLGVTRSGRQLHFNLKYTDRSPGFRADAGFVPRIDIRDVTLFTGYNFRPEGRWLIAWGPELFVDNTWDHSGRHLNWLYFMQLGAELAGQTNLAVGYAPEFEALRPQDHRALDRFRSYRRQTFSINFGSSYFRQLSISGELRSGKRIHLDPLPGRQPELAQRTSAEIGITLRPTTRLRIDNDYLFLRLRDLDDEASIFNNHIARSKWSWQFNRELSLRMILQYDAVLANPARTSLSTRRNFNTDLLLTYLLHPGTALHVGYNTNLRNLAIEPCRVGEVCVSRLVPTDEFVNDSRGLFVKFSYLFRF